MTLSDKLRHNDRKALSLFVTAGYPTLEGAAPLVVALANAGADLIELGIPFSDPIADGPTIQLSSEIALRNGMTLRKTFEIASAIRKASKIPIVLMGYANPIYSFGLDLFMKQCAERGIDGAIIPDLPLEESEEYRSFALKHSIATIFLASPTTPPGRLVQLDQASTGFLYCVSVTGVTGERKALANQAEQFLRQARSLVRRNQLLVGFGISTPEDARRVAVLSDGVIIGSALINVIQSARNGNAVGDAVTFVQSMRSALDSLG